MNPDRCTSVREAEVGVAYYKVLTQNLYVGAEESHSNTNQESRPTSYDK